jgi:hypothetical protein
LLARRREIGIMQAVGQQHNNSVIAACHAAQTSAAAPIIAKDSFLTHFLATFPMHGGVQSVYPHVSGCSPPITIHISSQRNHGKDRF